MRGTPKAVTAISNQSDEPTLRGRCKAEGVPAFAPSEDLIAQTQEFDELARRVVDTVNEQWAIARSEGVLPKLHGLVDDVGALYRFIMLDEIADELRSITRPPR